MTIASLLLVIVGVVAGNNVAASLIDAETALLRQVILHYEEEYRELAALPREPSSDTGFSADQWWRTVRKLAPFYDRYPHLTLFEEISVLRSVSVNGRSPRTGYLHLRKSNVANPDTKYLPRQLLIITDTGPNKSGGRIRLLDVEDPMDDTGTPREIYSYVTKNPIMELEVFPSRFDHYFVTIDQEGNLEAHTVSITGNGSIGDYTDTVTANEISRRRCRSGLAVVSHRTANAAVGKSVVCIRNNDLLIYNVIDNQLTEPVVVGDVDAVRVIGLAFNTVTFLNSTGHLHTLNTDPKIVTNLLLQVVNKTSLLVRDFTTPTPVVYIASDGTLTRLRLPSGEFSTSEIPVGDFLTHMQPITADTIAGISVDRGDGQEWLWVATVSHDTKIFPLFVHMLPGIADSLAVTPRYEGGGCLISVTTGGPDNFSMTVTYEVLFGNEIKSYSSTVTDVVPGIEPMQWQVTGVLVGVLAIIGYHLVRNRYSKISSKRQNRIDNK